MNYKKYNLLVVKILIGIILFICFTNYFIDPYGLYKTNQCFINRVKPDAKCQERLTKLLALEYRDNPETIFIGSSRVSLGMSPRYYSYIMQKSVSNMAMAGLNDVETKEILNYCEKFHPNIKTVVIGVDIEHFYQPTNQKSSIDYDVNKSQFTKYLPTIFSLDTTGSSFMTIIKNLNPHYVRGYDIDGIKRTFYNEEVEKSFGETINQYKDTGVDFRGKPNLTVLKGIVKQLKSKNINVILFIPPCHSTMYEILKQNGAWNDVSLYKEELAKIQPFYDFYYPSTYSNEKIKPSMKYFSETSHFTSFVGNRIMDKIFLNKGNYGYLVNSKNVKELNKKHNKELSEWESDNQDRVLEIKEIIERK